MARANWATCIENGQKLDFDSIPLGYPIEGATLRLVTEDGQEAAPGEPGELIISGPFVPPGYKNDPEKTAASFVPPTEPGGDFSVKTFFVAYRDFRGMFHTVGRTDDQIKSLTQKFS